MREKLLRGPGIIGVLLLGAALSLGFTAGCKRGGDKTADAGKSNVSAADVGKGKALYAKNTCATCHGDLGVGDGPAGKVLKPPPRNLQLAASYKQGSTAADIAETIKTGIPGTNMAAYGHIPEADRDLIAKFIVSLQKK